MADKQLTARVKLNITDVEKKIKQIERLTNKLNNVNTKQANTQAKVTREYNKTKQKANESLSLVDRIVQSTRRWYNAQGKVRNSIRGSNELLHSFGSKLKAIAATYLGVMGGKAALNTTDNFISAQNKLNYINGYDNKATDATMDKMYNSSQKVSMLYSDMMSNVSKSMALAGNSFGGSTDAAIRFQEIMAEAYAIGGASEAEKSSSMYQMIQALGAGTLAGDELRSVREGAPLAYKAIEEFAQGVYNTEESLKDLASQGKITSDMVVQAILENGGKMDEAFAKTEQTFAQTWTRIKNSATKAFEPVAEKLKEVLNNAIDNGLIEKVENFFSKVSMGLQIAMELVGRFASWVVNNWSWIEGILISGLTTLATLLVGVATIAIVNWIIAHWQLILIALAIFAIVYVLYAWQQGLISTADAFVYLGVIVALVLSVIALATGSLFLAIFALIIVLAALIFAAFEDICYWSTKIVTTIANVGIKFINWLIEKMGKFGVYLVNSAIGTINSILQLIECIVDPILTVIEFILNCCRGGFNSFGDACANLLGQIISWFLSLGKVATTVIDAIFGTNWSSELSALQDTVLSWGKNEKAITLDRKGLEIKRVEGALDLLDVEKLSNDAGDWGASVIEGINNWGSQFQKGGDKDIAKTLQDKLNLESMGKALGLDFDGLSDPNALLPSDDILKNLEGINSNTSDIADNMDLADDDLEFLRKIADMEWRKEFTTAEIKIDMTNNNTVNGERDLDGIVEHLADVLRSEMTSVAEGVHY